MATKKGLPVWAVLILWGSFLFVGYLIAESLSIALRVLKLTDLLLACLIVGAFGSWLLSGKGGGQRKPTKTRRRK